MFNFALSRGVARWWMIWAFILMTTLGAWAQEIQLLVRADDMGVAHTANLACIRSYREGVARSTEVIVPGAWFLDAVKLLNENPGLDVGVHLTLTSEWAKCKWRPLTYAPSLVDEDGYFRPMNNQRPGFPPGSGFLDAKPSLEDVEKELRAQIEMARRHIPRISHVSAHMGTATATPALKEIVLKLVKEYQLGLEWEGVKSAGGFPGNTPEEREASFVKLLENLKPGTWLVIEHPGMDTLEMQAFGHLGYENVALDREGVTRAFSSPSALEMVKKRGIKLVSYGDLRAQR